MYRITYYIGCNDKDTLKQELPDEFFISVFDSWFDNYTLTQAQGRFTNKDGVKTFEKSFVVTFLLDIKDKETSKEWIENNCMYLKRRLNQESILVTKELIQADFM